MIHLGCLNGMILVGDLCNVGVGIYIALNDQRPRFFIDNAEITGLLGGRRGAYSKRKVDQKAT